MRTHLPGRQRPASLLGAVGALTVLVQCPAFAQEPEGGLEEIVVTAQKRAESVQDIPVSIAALSGDALQSSGVDAQVALGALTPGVAVNQNANFTAVYIRGVGTQYANPGLEPSVGTYFDDVYLSRASSGFVSFADVERVEVLKGPQGILYGRNTTGGIIRVVTKDPTKEFEAGIGLQAGNYDAYQGDGFISGPFTDSVQGRMAVQYEQNDGWVKNLTPGLPKLMQREAYLVRGKLNWDVNDELSVKFMADYSEREGIEGLAFLPLFDGLPEQAVLALVPGAQIDPNGKKYSGSIPVDDSADAFHLRVGGAEVRVDYTGSGFTASSISGYRYNRFNGIADLDATTAPFYNANTRKDLSLDWSQEFQIVSDNSGPLQYVGGLFYWHEIAEDDFGASGLAVDASFGGPPASPANSTNFVGGHGRVEIESYAPYGQVTYAITPQWEVLAGARYTVEEKKLKFNRWYVTTADAVTTQVNGPENVIAEAAPDKFKEKELTPKVGVNWKPIDDVMLYASFSKGFKSGGFNLPDPAPPSPDKVASEKVDAYEVGWKAEFGVFRVNGAYFHYKAKDLQIQVTDPSGGGITSIRNAASSKTDGVELDVTAAVTPDLQIGAGIGWLDAKFDKFADGQAFIPCGEAAALGLVDAGGPAGACAAFGGTLGLATVVEDQAGNYLPQAPEWTGNIRIDYSLSLPGNMGALAFNAVESYTGKFYWTADNLYEEPSKWLLNASVRWTSSDGHFGASLYGTNLTDEEYNTHQATFPFTGGWRVPGAPRLYGARVTYTF